MTFFDWSNERPCSVRNQKEFLIIFLLVTHFWFIHGLAHCIYEQYESVAVLSRERFTTDTAYRGFVTKSQLLEKLFTRNLLTFVGHIKQTVY